MALEDDLDPRLLEDFVKQMQSTGTITKELQKEIDKTNSSFTKLRSEGIKKTWEGFKAVSGASKDLATNLIDGNRGFTALNPAIDLTANALTSMTSFIPFLGKAVAGGAKLVAEGSKLLLKNLESQVGAFQEVGTVGGLAADGLTGLQEQFIASGLTLEDYTKAVADSSKTLARFSGDTATGAQQFSEIVGNLTKGTDDGLRRLGLSTEQLGESTEAFLSRQTRLGLSQGLTAAQLSAQTTEYIKELDMLSKATGLSRRAIQEQQDAALSESRFRAVLQQEAANNNREGAKQLQNFSASFGEMPGIAQGIRDLSANLGPGVSDAAKRLQMLTGGLADGIVQQIRTGEMSEIEGRKAIQAALKANQAQIMAAGLQVGDNVAVLAQGAEAFDIITAKITDTGFDLERTQEAQIKGSDGLTDSAVATEKALVQAQNNLQNLFFAAMPGATKVVETFTTTMNESIIKMTSMIDADLAQKLNKDLFKRTGNAVDIGDDALDSLNERLMRDKANKEQTVSADELITALTGMGIDTTKDGHALNFARKYGLEDTREGIHRRQIQDCRRRIWSSQRYKV